MAAAYKSYTHTNEKSAKKSRTYTFNLLIPGPMTEI